MSKKILILLALFGFFVLPALGYEAEKAPDARAGYALLEMLTDQFRQMAAVGSGGFEKVDQMLQRCMADAKTAREADRIDKVFFARYARMLSLMKIWMIPDPQAVLRPIIDREIERFVMEVLGEDRRCENKGIGQVAGAFADEIVNLHLYLDDAAARVRVMKTYEERGSVKE